MPRPPQFLVWIVLTHSLTAMGCSRSGPPTENSRATPVTREPSWAEQIRAVRQGDSSGIHVSAPVSAAEWSELASGCERLSSIGIKHLDAPDSAFSQLAGLPQLRQLRIGSAVGDAGLEEIARATSLRVVNLPQGQFTDAGLGCLVPLPHLELLRFHSPHVTDDGMNHIAQMRSLRFLHLIDVPITDAGLAPLHGLTHLESFYLDGGHCTNDGLEQLLEALPELHFHRDQLHLPGDPHAHPH